MERKLFNLKSRDTKAKETVVIEFLQVTKLCVSGQVRYISLEGMTTQEIKDGEVLVEGVPLVIELKEDEYIMAVSRAKIVKKGTGNQIRVHLFPYNGAPVFAFVGYFGSIEKQNELNFWRFPQIDQAFNLYEIMTKGGTPE